MKSVAVSLALALSLGVLVWAVLRPAGNPSETANAQSRASRLAPGPGGSGHFPDRHSLEVPFEEDPDATVRRLVPGSEAARASGIAYANFLPEDWEARLDEEVRDAWEEYTRNRSARLHPNAERMLRESGHDTLIVEETAGGIAPMTLDKPEEGRR